MITIIFAPDYKSAHYYMRVFNIEDGIPLPPTMSSLRGVSGTDKDVIIVNTDNGSYNKQFLDELARLQLVHQVDVTWFGFGELHE